jgi:lipoyl(octanoyl) transferase
MRPLEVRYLGVVPYAEADNLQRTLVEERRAGRVPDLLLLLEHPHVITLGVKLGAARSHLVATPELLTQRSVEVHESGRGGDITYHGPGQLVGYPILDLRPDRCDVHKYVRDLEEVMIRAAADFGLTAHRVEGLTGAWVGADKLGAIGVRISRWITSHGFAFNVMTDLDYFKLIVPCGISSGGVTSVSRAAGRPVGMAEARAAIVARFCGVFDRQVVGEADAAVSAAGTPVGSAAK